MKPRPYFRLAAIVFVLLALLGSSIYLQLELPAPTGPYLVGRTIFRWVDPSRPEVMTADPNDAREVMALVWYPAVPGTGRSAEYFPDISRLAGTLLASGELSWWEVTGLRAVRSDSPMDAQPISDEGPFPVVVFLPGNGTNIEFYASLAGEIASHGYIVVGINHPYDVAAVELSNGSLAAYDKDQWLLAMEAHQAYITERHQVKIADVLFVMEKLHSLATDSNSPFAGRMDLNSVAVAGHSLGGIVASDVCKLDARFKACINLDGIQKGGPFSMDETAIPPEQPFLFLTKESQLHPKFLQTFDATTESYWVVIHGASHDGFTDGPLLQPSLLPISSQADRHMELIEKYTLAFLDKTLIGKPDILLARTTQHEDVSVQVYPSR